MRNADVITVRSPGAARGLGLPEAYYHSSWSDWFNYLFRLIPLLESSLFSPFFLVGGGNCSHLSPPCPPPAHEPATYYEPILNLPQVLNLFVLYLRPVARGGGVQGVGKHPPPWSQSVQNSPQFWTYFA